MIPRLGGWYHRPLGVSPLIFLIPMLLSNFMMALLAPRIGGCALMNNRCGFYGSPNSQARGLDTAKLLNVDSCEDWRPENFYTVCHDFWTLNSKSWNLDSRLGGCGIRVIDGLFFKFFEDTSQKIED